jgi:1-aminocyclopropane-1-carboxylate deaminase/D-cysteine desulfhydrase-like pyridoxal-dependent ACC family enzyme
VAHRCAMLVGMHYGPLEFTPVQRVGEYYVKRDDLCEVAGVYGGKVRACYALAKRAVDFGRNHLVTAGSRHSPQCHIVAAIGAHLGLAVTVHVPSGELGPEIEDAKRLGATVVQHKPGYNSVICKRAKDHGDQHRCYYIPFGMECVEAVRQTAGQVALASFPPAVKRIVIPVGSGMSAAGVVVGVRRLDRAFQVPIVGVQVGADPTQRLNLYAGRWQDHLTIVKSAMRYEDHVDGAKLGDIALDPVYEAKCLPYLRPGDMLWVVGVRATR